MVRIVLAHGFAQTGSCWGPLAGWLRAEGHDVATPNLAGHGAKPMPAAGLPGTARALGEQGGPAVYVGYSFGGRVALRLAMDRPDLVAGLVLIGATAGLEDPAERAARVASDELLARSIEATGVAEFLDRWLALPLFAGVPTAYQFREERLANPAASLAASLRLAGTGALEPLWDRLGSISAPTLVVAGAYDRKFCAIADRLAAGIPGATQVVVPGAGHSVQLEQPERLFRILSAWLPRVACSVEATPVPARRRQ